MLLGLGVLTLSCDQNSELDSASYQQDAVNKEIANLPQDKRSIINNVLANIPESIEPQASRDIITSYLSVVT